MMVQAIAPPPVAYPPVIQRALDEFDFGTAYHGLEPSRDTLYRLRQQRVPLALDLRDAKRELDRLEAQLRRDGVVTGKNEQERKDALLLDAPADPAYTAQQATVREGERRLALLDADIANEEERGKNARARLGALQAFLGALASTL